MNRAIVIGATSICGAALVSFAGDAVYKTEGFTWFKLNFFRVEPIPQVKLEGIPLIRNTKVTEAIGAAFDSKLGGALILYAPPGSGKTTYLSLVAKEFQKKGRHVEFVSCASGKHHLYDCLSIPSTSYQLSEVLPNKSVLVLDQMETPVLGPELKSMLQEIALDSRKNKTFILIVAVSNIESAKKMLNLNGNDKIKLLGPCEAYRWDRELVCAYVEQSTRYTDWSDADKAALVELGCRAGAPEFLFQLEDEEGLTPARLDDPTLIAKVDAYARGWAAAEKAGL